MILRIPKTLSVASAGGDVSQLQTGTAQMEGARGGLLLFLKTYCDRNVLQPRSGERISDRREGEFILHGPFSHWLLSFPEAASKSAN